MCSITVGNPALDCPNGYYRSSYPITSDLACMKIEEGCQSNICYIGADDIGEK